ncbi:hypothetical protein [Paenibacillus amylolyticus]|uniref:DUF3024 domain-containing protein n=1 Tax=Paenibacillus amylolyticus TaxID=1451 RepID=UPI003450633C
MDDFTKKRIQKIMDHYTENAVPEHVKSQIKISYKIRGKHVMLIEERQAFQSDQWVQMPVAQFRLDEKAWKVYWQDSKGKCISSMISNRTKILKHNSRSLNKVITECSGVNFSYVKSATIEETEATEWTRRHTWQSIFQT